MHPFPHMYSVTAASGAVGTVSLDAEGAPRLAAAAPPQFDGPGDQWSPESLLVAALASCFILTFRAMARASKLDWTRLECEVTGTLDRVEGVTQFTGVVTRASLTAAPETDTLLCERVLVKAEHGCLVANSLRCSRELQMEIVKGAAAEVQSAAELSCAG